MPLRSHDESSQREVGVTPAITNQHPTLLYVAAILILGGLLTYGVYLWGFGVTGEDPGRPLTIGILAIPQVPEADAGFKEKIAELGYTNVTFLEEVFVPGPTFYEDSKKTAREMIERNVDLIFADYETQAKAALDATTELSRSDIPVIFISRLHDPIRFGLIEALQSSGNNATGVAADIVGLVERHFYFILEIKSDAKKLGAFTKGFQIPSIADEYFEEIKRQAPRFGFSVVEYTTDAPPPNAKAEFDRIATTIKKGDIDAIMHVGGHYYATQEAGESELAIQLGIPMATNWEDITRGGHFTFSNGTRDSGEQAAVMADKILRGTKPTDIPVEYAQKAMLSLHLGRAREAGFEFPESMLFIAENKFDNDSFPAFEDH